MRRAWPLLLLAVIGFLFWLVRAQGTEPREGMAPPPTEASDTAGETAHAARSSARRRRTSKAPDTGEADENEAEGSAPAEDAEIGVPWSVTVLGPDDTPAVGVEVKVALRPPERFRTDESGRAQLGDFPPNATIAIELPGLPWESHSLAEQHTVLRVPQLIPLELHVVDGSTGAEVHGARVSIAGAGRAIPLPSAPGGGFLLPASPAHPGSPFALSFRVEPPPSHALAFEKAFAVTGTISRYAKKVLVELVVRRETGLEVRVREHDGNPAVGATILGLTVAGRSHSFKAEPADENGVIEVRGLPFLHGERALLTAGKEGRTAKAPPAIITAPGVLQVVEVTLPESAATGGGFFGHRGDRRNLRSSGDGARTVPVGTGRIEAFVVRRDGTPAVETMVVLMGFRRARTDSFGRVVFDKLPAQGFTLVVLEPGFVRVSKNVRLEDGESLQVTLHEPAGRAATIALVDADGAPVPFASLTVSTSTGVPYVVLDGTVQRLSIHTDAYGRCELDGLPSGKVTVTARFGSRTATGVLTSDHQLTLRLAPVK